LRWHWLGNACKLSQNSLDGGAGGRLTSSLFKER